MTQNRTYKILSRFVDIKPGEEIITILLFLYLLLIIAPYTIVKSIRIASYLDILGANKLPFAYLLTAVIIGFIVALHSKLQVKFSRHVLIISSLIFFLLTSLLFWFLFPYGWKLLSLIFWIWTNVFIVVLKTQFWFVVNDVFNPREAKRLLGFFVSGATLGGVIGGALTGFFAKSKVAYNLIFLASGLLIACIFIVHIIYSQEKKRIVVSDKINNKYEKSLEELQKVGFKDCFNTVRKNYYLNLLAAIVATIIIVSTLIDFQFNSIVAATQSLKDKLTSFYGFFTVGMLVFPLLIQLLLTSRIIKRYGILFALLLYPLILLFCSLGVAVFVTIYFAIIIKASDKSLNYSLNQSVQELLYIPISPELKYKAKIFIDMFLNRFSKIFGAVILLILIYFHLGLQYVSLVSAMFIILWIILNLKVSKEYVNTVKERLKLKWVRGEKLVAEKVDIDYTKLVFDTLESKNRSSVLYAMHLFDLIKQDKLTPELRKLISYKSDEIRASSLGTLLEEEDTTISPEFEDYIDDEVLKKEVSEIMSLDIYKEVMMSYIDKIIADKSRKAETAKMEVAKAIGLMEPNSPFVQKLKKLIQDKSPEVSRYAIESAAKLKKKEHLPILIEKLDNLILKEHLISALEKFGSNAVEDLGSYLKSDKEAIGVRKGIVSVLARIGTQKAADLLIEELKKDKINLDFEIIDALDRIRSEKLDIKFSEKIVKTKLSKEIKKYYQELINFCDSKFKGEIEEMSEDLKNYLSIFLMNIFKLLSLIYPHEDISKAYQNINIGSKESMAYAIELLDNTLKKEMRAVIFPLIEDHPIEEIGKKCRRLLKTFPTL